MNLIERCTTEFKTKRFEKPQWIIVHYTACLASPIIVCDSMRRNANCKASTNYIVGGDQVVHCVDESKFYAWHCATANVKTYCNATNKNAIGVDLCEKKLFPARKLAGDTDWYFDEETTKTAATLIAELCVKYDIPLSNVVRHYDVTHKQCPRPFVGDDVNKYYNATGNHQWRSFKRKISRAIDRITSATKPNDGEQKTE